MSDIYTVSTKDVARLFGITYLNAWQWGEKKFLDCIRLPNRQFRFNELVVNEWLAKLNGYTLTTDDVMKMAGVSDETVAKWIKAGYFSCKKNPGGKRLYNLSEVERFLLSRAEKLVVPPDFEKKGYTLNTKDVMALAGVNKTTVSLWVKEGKISCKKTADGKCWYNAAEVKKFLASRNPVLTHVKVEPIVVGPDTVLRWTKGGEIECIKSPNVRSKEEAIAHLELEFEGYVLTIKDVLEAANISSSTLYRDTKSGKIPSIKIFGGQRRYKLSEVEEYLVLRGK